LINQKEIKDKIINTGNTRKDDEWGEDKLWRRKRLFGEFLEMVMIREIRHKNERAEMAECCQNKSMKEIEIGIK